MTTEHLTLDQALGLLLKAAKHNLVVLAIYDNPDNEHDDAARLIQPVYVVQAQRNLLCAAWQYAPSCDWRLFRLHYFVGLHATPYAGLFHSSNFGLDGVMSFSEYQEISNRVPYDRRSSRRRDIEVFYFEALAQIRGKSLKAGTLRYPQCTLPYPR